MAINVKKTKVMLAGSIKKDRAFSSFDDVNLQMNGTQVELDSNVNILEKKWTQNGDGSHISVVC